MKTPCRSLAILFVSGLAAHDVMAQSKLAKPVIDTINHRIVRVMNSGPTAWTETNGWKLTLDLTIQPPDGTPGELANPETVLRTSKGEYVVGDPRAPSITLYSMAGKFVRQIGRAGAGPGEYRAPQIAQFHDTLVYFDSRLARVEIVTREGKEIRAFTIKSNSGFGSLQIDNRGRLCIPQYHGNNVTVWELVDWKSGLVVDSFPSTVSPPGSSWSYTVPGGSGSASIPLAPWNVFSVTHDGALLHGTTDRFEFLLTRKGADTTRIFGRTGVIGVPVPQQLRDSMFHANTDKNAPVAAVAKPSDVPRTYGLWQTLDEDGGGNIWVSADAQLTGRFRYDVFSPTGAFLGMVPAPFQRPARVSFMGDRIAVMDTDANDLPRIRIFRIDRRGH